MSRQTGNPSPATDWLGGGFPGSLLELFCTLGPLLMHTHSIRLKGPWLVGLSGATPSVLEAGGQHSGRQDLAEQIGQLLATAPTPHGVWAIRRFHRPTGLSPRSELSLAIQASQQPDSVNWGPLEPGARAANSYTRLEPGNDSGAGVEYRLPCELPLRSELRLEWTKLELHPAPGGLSVELVIREPA